MHLGFSPVVVREAIDRHNRNRAMLLASPQLVGYVSELPAPGAYCT
jgi:carnitine monooxygenase subunit